MIALGDMIGDWHVVRLVGQDQPRRLVAEKLSVHLRVGRVTTDNPMTAIEHKDIAQPRNRWSFRARGEGALLGGLNHIVQRDLVEFCNGKCSVFDLDPFVDEFDQFRLQFGKGPMTFLAQPIQGQPHDALFRGGEMRRANAGDRGQAELLGRRGGGDAVKDLLSWSIRTGATKPTFVIEFITRRTCTGLIVRTLRLGVLSSLGSR